MAMKMISKELKRELKRIKVLSLPDAKTIYELLASASEELGEVARALLIEDGIKGNPENLKESSKSEAVDLTICALAIFYARGGKHKELIKILKAKLDKWESQI